MEYKELINWGIGWSTTHFGRGMSEPSSIISKMAIAIETLLAERESAGWIRVKDRLPEQKGEYFVLEKWVCPADEEEEYSEPIESEELGIAWFTGERFCDIISRSGSTQDAECVTHWARMSKPQMED